MRRVPRSLAAADGEPGEIDQLRELGAIRVEESGRDSPFALIVRGERIVHIADLREIGASHGHVCSQGAGLGVQGQFSGRWFGSKV